MPIPQVEVWKKVQALIQDPEGAEAALLRAVHSINKPIRCKHHNQVEIDLKDRKIKCLRCETYLSPWEYILALTETSDTVYERYNELAKRCADLRTEKAELKKDIRNAKSRFSYHQKKLFK